MTKDILTLLVLLSATSLVGIMMITADNRRQEYRTGCKIKGGELVQLSSRDGKTVCARVEIL